MNNHALSFLIAIIMTVFVFEANAQLTDSLCMPVSVAPDIIAPANAPVDADGNLIVCTDGSSDPYYYFGTPNGNLPNNDYLLEFSNGTPLEISADGTWDSQLLGLQPGDKVYITAVTYDLDSINGDLVFAETLCPLLDVLYPDILPCGPIDTLLNGLNDGVPGLGDMNEVISFASSLSGEIESLDSLVDSFYGINDAIAGFGAAICFGISETLTITAVECSPGCTDVISNVDASICEGETYTLVDSSVVSDAGSYTVAIPLDNGCDSLIITELSLLESYETMATVEIYDGTDYTLVDGTVVSDAGDYEATVAAENGCDSTVTITLEVLVSIEDHSNNNILVYPQLVEESVNIQFSQQFEEITEILIINEIGNIVVNKSKSQNQLININMSDLNSGLYFIYIKTELGETIKKVIKI